MSFGCEVVKRMRARPVDLGQPPDQAGEAPRRAVVRAVVGVHVLAEERDLAHAAVHEVLRLVQDLGHGARDFGSARVGDDAEGAELVATFLHGQEGRGAAPRLGAVLQRRELVVLGEVGVERAGALPHLGFQFGEAVVALRPDDEVDGGLAAHDLFALGLGDAARDADPEVRVQRLERLQPPEFGIDLLGRLLADVAGVEQDQVGRLGRVGGDVALRRQRLGHALAVVDVHLAAVGADEELLLLAHGPVPVDQGRVIHGEARCGNGCKGMPRPATLPPCGTGRSRSSPGARAR
jgi:hypothetical protein